MRRQLWGTGARAPSTSNYLIFQVTSELLTNSDIRLHVVTYPVKEPAWHILRILGHQLRSYRIAALSTV